MEENVIFRQQRMGSSLIVVDVTNDFVAVQHAWSETTCLAMPLHLLGKKSWNVYNTENIERVRRDEADARAKEEAEEQRQQEEDAAARIGLLRERRDTRFETVVDDSVESNETAGHDSLQAGRKRRRYRGEDDTDRDLRYAREDKRAGESAAKRLRIGKDNSSLHDDQGRLLLIKEPAAETPSVRMQSRSLHETNNNTFGEQFNQTKPWYLQKSESHQAEQSLRADTLDTLPNTNVWGRDDIRRKDRESKRINIADPLAFMKTAQSQLKHNEAQKRRWAEERRIELAELERTQVAHKTDSRLRPSKHERHGKHSHGKHRAKDRQESRHQHRHARDAESDRDARSTQNL